MKSLCLLFACLLFLFVGCSSKNEPIKAKKESSVVTAPAPTAKLVPYVAPPAPTKGHYKHFGFCGSYFRDMKPGMSDSIEGGLLVLYSKDGSMWAIDTEPNDNHAPLDQRKIYLARISGEVSTKKCGVWLRQFTVVPSRCIEEERVASWKTTRKFMLENTSAGEHQYVAEVEKFLQNRSIKE